MNKQFDEFKEEIRGFSIKKLPTLSGSTTIKISALVLLFAILIASISTCSHTKKLLEQSKKTMEIAITPENF